MSWLRRIAFVFAGLVLLLAGVWYWALHTNSGARWIWVQAQSATNGRLQAADVDGDLTGGLSILQPEFVSDGASVSANVVFTRVDVDLLPLQVKIVELEVEGANVQLAAGETESEPSEDGATASLPQSPFRLVFSDVEVLGIEVERDSEQLIELSRVALAGQWHNEIMIESVQLLADAISFTAELDGALHDYRYHASTVVSGTEFGDLTVVAVGSGSLDYLIARSVNVDGEGLDAVGSAEVSWALGLAGSVALDVAELDMSRVVADWPDEHPLYGQLRLRADGDDIVLDETVVRVAGQPAVVNLNLLFDRDTADISGRVDWSELAWPLNIPMVMSEVGDVQVSGSLDDWNVSGTIDVGTAQMPDGRFTLDGNGSRDFVSARIDEGRAFGGAVSGDVTYRWRDEQPWSATLALVDVQTTILLPGWPGNISGRVQANGTNRPFSIAAQLDGVDGILRQQSLAVNGGFEYDGRLLAAENLQLDHGDAHLRLNGSTHNESGLQFLLRVTDLSNYTDQVAGDVYAEGRVSGLENYLSVSANSERLLIGGQPLHDVAVSLNYAESSQELTLDGAFFDTPFGLSINGAFADWQRPLDSVWSGEVRTLNIDLADEHSLSLRNAATLTAARNRINLQDFCINDATGAELCVKFTSNPDGALNLAAAMTDLPVMLSEHFVDHSLNFTQRVNGTVDWQRSRNGDTQGQADLEIAAGQLSSANDPSLVLQTDAGHLRFTVRNQRLLAGDLFVPLPDVGQVDADFAVLDVRQGAASAVTGEAVVRMSQIGIVADFSPVIDSIGGTLESSLSLAGTVGAPELTGTLNVDNGEILYAPIGLHLREIDLDGSLQKNRSFQLSGDFKAGDGLGHIVSSAEYGNPDHSGLRFRVQGNDLQLVNVPNLQAVIAPDFEITYDQQQLGINGSVDITRMRIAPTNLTDGRVNESDDVVIVAGELPDAKVVSDDEQRIEYHGNLDVTLGDSVVVDLNVARASLDGGVSFEWQGDVLPIADGRIGIDGSVEAFGQVLEVTEGIINFPSVPADNPSVRVRAEREIYGNSQVKRAGILVDGYVDRPTIEPYTVPMTTEERALTLLVTGSDFDYEQGVGAVDFGTYIAPRLFVSYGIGIFDRDNVISARYDLSSGFGIKASSGSKESGFDLNYRFEN